MPQVELANPATVKLAKLVETKDLNEEGFKNLVDNGDRFQMNKDTFAQVMKGSNFNLSSSESEQIFKLVLDKKAQSGYTAKIKTDHLVKHVFKAVKAIVIDKARNVLTKIGQAPTVLVKNHGSQGSIDDQAFGKLLKDNGYVIGKNMGELLMFGVIDTRKTSTTISRRAKINASMIKSVFEVCGTISGNPVSSFAAKPQEEEKSQFNGV